MNMWLLLMIPLALTWIIPLKIMQQAGAPAALYPVSALFFCLIAWFAESLYDWATNLGRKLGHTRMVAFRERIKPSIIPAVRVALVIMILLSLLFWFIS